MVRKRQQIRKLTVTGKTATYYLTLPKDIIRDLGWKKGEKKIVYREAKKIIIKDWQP
jgi:bifunctional DNA-binding transcriptional regulator/antitoxin component of YhaV-PrlF toxin-antitoxin module